MRNVQSFLLIFIHLCSGLGAHNVKPLLMFEVEEFPSLFVITNGTTPEPVVITSNSVVKLTLICTSNMPIQMVYDYKLSEKETYFTGANQQYLHRASQHFWNPASYIYKALMETSLKQYRKIGSISCQTIDGPEQLSATIVFGTNLKDKTIISFNIDAAVQDNSQNDENCGINFEVQETENGAQWSCKPENLNNPNEMWMKIKFAYCYSSADCRNLVRSIQDQKTCLKRLGPNETCHDCKDPSQFITDKKKFHPQLIICSTSNIQRAILYFYSFPPDGAPENHKLHISWNEVNGADMLFLELPSKSKFFVGERLDVTCHGNQYYFTLGYRIGIEMNGNGIKMIPEGGNYNRDSITNARVVKQSILLNDTENASVYCFGPVMNSSEWVNKSFQILIEAKPAVPISNPALDDATASTSDKDTQFPIALTSLGVVTGLLILIVVIVVGFCRRVREVEIQIQKLSDEDIKHFRDGGNPGDRPVYVESMYINICNESPIDYLPYNSRYEIPRNQIHLEEKLLGSGAYGIVRKGVVWYDTELVEVAIKTIRPGCDVDHVKALLSELKIMAYLDNGHSNIVRLVAACTENIKNRDLLVGVELCRMSLLDALRSDSKTFVNLLNEGQLVRETSLTSPPSYTNIGNEKLMQISTDDLIRWSYEIADGMEYLYSKRVIHGDLAARNILLTGDNIVKICDFGLARQLVDYNYIKSEQCPLPWKWMAIESLSEMKFSSSSDIWSYGVVLWEIFSLGQIPYAGLSWTPDFIKQLKSGLRMSIPEYSTEDMYQLMVCCWKPEPKSRPTFSYCKEYFDNILRRSDNDLTLGLKV